MDIRYLTQYLKSSISNIQTAFVDPNAFLPANQTSTSIFSYLRPKSETNSILTILGNRVRPLKDELHKVRCIKSDVEVRLMKTAGEISGTAHAKVDFFFISHVYEETYI